MNGTQLARVQRIDGETGEVLPAAPAVGPRELYRQATDVAGVCREIVCKTSKRIGNRDHVAVEGWQAIATSHGCMLSIKSVAEDEAGNVTAIACVRRMSDGVEMSEAEGFVGMDEKTWAGRQRYARRAMAQTRAMSRVARAAFAHVVILIDANLATTPAEEIPDADYDRPAPPPRQPQRDPFIDQYLAAVTKRGFSEERAHGFLRHFLETKEITLDRLDADARAKLLRMVNDGSFDAWLRPPAPKQPETNAGDVPLVGLHAEQEPAPAPNDGPPVDVVREAMEQDEYPLTLVEALKKHNGVSQDLAMKAVNGFVKLDSPNGEAGDVPLEKRVSAFKAISESRAQVTKTGTLRWD